MYGNKTDDSGVYYAYLDDQQSFLEFFLSQRCDVGWNDLLILNESNNLHLFYC